MIKKLMFSGGLYSSIALAQVAPPDICSFSRVRSALFKDCTGEMCAGRDIKSPFFLVFNDGEQFLEAIPGLEPFFPSAYIALNESAEFLSKVIIKDGKSETLHQTSIRGSVISDYSNNGSSWQPVNAVKRSYDHLPEGQSTYLALRFKNKMGQRVLGYLEVQKRGPRVMIGDAFLSGPNSKSIFVGEHLCKPQLRIVANHQDKVVSVRIDSFHNNQDFVLRALAYPNAREHDKVHYFEGEYRAGVDYKIPFSAFDRIGKIKRISDKLVFIDGKLIDKNYGKKLQSLWMEVPVRKGARTGLVELLRYLNGNNPKSFQLHQRLNDIWGNRIHTNTVGYSKVVVQPGNTELVSFPFLNKFSFDPADILGSSFTTGQSDKDSDFLAVMESETKSTNYVYSKEEARWKRLAHPKSEERPGATYSTPVISNPSTLASDIFTDDPFGPDPFGDNPFGDDPFSFPAVVLEKGSASDFTVYHGQSYAYKNGGGTEPDVLISVGDLRASGTANLYYVPGVNYISSPFARPIMLNSEDRYSKSVLALGSGAQSGNVPDEADGIWIWDQKRNGYLVYFLAGPELGALSGKWVDENYQPAPNNLVLPNMGFVYKRVATEPILMKISRPY